VEPRPNLDLASRPPAVRTWRQLGLDRRIVAVNAAGATPFGADARAFEASLSLSRDGKQSRWSFPIRAAHTKRGPRHRSCRTCAACWRSQRRFFGAWSPTGEWLAFSRNGRDKDDGVYVQRSDGSRKPSGLQDRYGRRVGVNGWMADGTASSSQVHSGQDRILMLPVSPDGRSTKACVNQKLAWARGLA
jgi:hypothetical protein